MTPGVYAGGTPNRWVRHDLEAARLESSRTRSIENGIGCLLIGSAPNLRYLAGIGPLDSLRPTWLVVPAQGGATLVVARSEHSVVAPTTWIADIREYVEWPDDRIADDWSSLVATVARESGNQNAVVGIEFEHVTMAVLAQLRAALPGAKFVSADGLLGGLRTRKDDHELELMRIGGRVHVAQLDGARASIAPGVSEYEISLAGRAAGARAAARVLGSDDDHMMSPMLDKPQTLGTGPRSAMVHARASTQQVAAGDVVQICFCGPAFFGYTIGFDRPLVVGQSSREARAILEAALAAHDAALDSVRPGVPASVVHAAAVSVLAETGFLQHRAHRTGRGVGLGGQESPEIRESDSTLLAPGMTFTVEMGIYVPGVAGARFGDTVAVTDGGYEMLTPASYDWSV
jgi:Xaa-Pro aminopeptidase